MSQICAACGNLVDASDKFCRVCGRQLGTAPLGTMPTLASTSPVGSAETSPKAVISLVCGLLFFVPLAFLAAIVFGHLGLSEIRRSAGRLKGEGLAIAGLVLGYIWIAAIPLVLIIAAIAIPNLLRARMAANEASAVSMVRSITAAETTYAAAHSGEGFTCSLPSLTESTLNVRGFANGQRFGYVFELSECSAATENAANTKYQVVAYPLRRDQTGVRAFCSDETGILKVDAGGSPQRCLESGRELQ